MSASDKQSEEGVDSILTIPTVTSPEWTPYVMGHFTANELVNGNPRVSGLRRVTELLIGSIIENTSSIVEAPSATNGWRAVAQCTIKAHVFLIDKTQALNLVETVYSDVADCFSGNISSKEIVPYLCATAATRAEGRALRKLLRLGAGVIAAEEGVQDDSLPQMKVLDKTQLNVLDKLCSRLDINAWSFINVGSQKYDNLEEVPHDIAIKMLEHLNKIMRKESPTPEGVSGYQKSWKKSLVKEKE